MHQFGAMVVIEQWTSRGVIRPQFGRVNEKLEKGFSVIALSMRLVSMTNLEISKLAVTNKIVN